MRTILITGTTNGLGKEITKLLSKDNKLIILGRNEKLLINLKEELNSNLNYYVCDFNDESSIYNAVENIKKDYSHIDLIINNAGALLSPNGDIHPALKVNFLAPMLLNDLLVDLLLKSSNPTIFYTSTMAVPKEINDKILTDLKDYKKIKSYAISKLLFNLYLKKLSDKYNIDIKIFDPKIMYTNAVKSMIPYPFKWITPLARIIAKNPEVVARKALNVINTKNTEKLEFYKLDKKFYPKRLLNHYQNSINLIEKYNNNLK